MNTVDGDLRVRGRVIPDAMTIPASSVGNTQFNAADPLAVANQQHQYVKQLAQVNGSAAAAERRVIHRVYGATGTLLDFKAGLVTAAVGAATVTVDLRKNGASVLNTVDHPRQHRHRLRQPHRHVQRHRPRRRGRARSGDHRGRGRRHAPPGRVGRVRPQGGRPVIGFTREEDFRRMAAAVRAVERDRGRVYGSTRSTGPRPPRRRCSSSSPARPSRPGVYNGNFAEWDENSAQWLANDACLVRGANGGALAPGTYLGRVADQSGDLAVVQVGFTRQVTKGKLAGALSSVGGSATMNVWERSGGAEAWTGETLTVYDWLLKSGQSIPSGTRVTALIVNGRWYVNGAQCS
jgi:hypothetical protein